MKLIHYPGLPSLSDFGIEIPVLDTRATRTIEELRELPGTGALLDSLLITDRSENLSEEDLLRTHDAEYIDRLLHSDRINVLHDAYELIDENGNYQRFNPSSASYPLEQLYDVILTKASGSLHCMR
ncbi:MAG: histone deacetylase, partial [Spirochaetia bacterium]